MPDILTNLIKLKKQKHELIISNDYWEIIHDQHRGGTISSIKFSHTPAIPYNILQEPISCRVARLTSFLDEKLPEEYRDEFDPQPTVSYEITSENSLNIQAEARLLTAQGKFSGVKSLTNYRYTNNYIAVSRKFIFAPDSLELNRVSAVMIALNPALDRWTARNSPVTLCSQETAAQYQTMSGTNFPNHWGHFDSFVSEFYEWRASSQLVIYTPNGPAVEIMPTGDIDQWDEQFFSPENRRCGYSYIKKLSLPSRHVMGIDPYLGAELTPAHFVGEYEFDFNLALPNIAANGYDKKALWMNSLLRLRKNAPWVSESEIKDMADHGVQVLIHHHDCAKGFGCWPDNSFFWPTGVFPPYSSEQREEFKARVEMAHRYGLKVIPYFNIGEIHDRCSKLDAVKNAWALVINGRQNHSVYGYPTCLHSKFSDFLKNYIREVISYFNLDGAYFDGFNPHYCENPQHCNGHRHYTVNETLEIAEYTRKLLGEQGIIVVHNSGLPWIAAENMVDMSVGMEYISGFPNYEGSIPDLPDYDLTNTLGNQVAHSICGYTAVRFNAPNYQELCSKLVTSCLLNGITFKGFSLNAVNEYERYKRLSKMMKGFIPENFKFIRWDQLALPVAPCAAAAYVSKQTAYIIIGNHAEPETVSITVNFSPEIFGWSAQLSVFDEAGQQVPVVQQLEVAGYSYVLFRIEAIKN